MIHNEPDAAIRFYLVKPLDLKMTEKRSKKTMMELPESYMLSHQINEKLTGKIISEIQILQTPHKFAFFKSRYW